MGYPAGCDMSAIDDRVVRVLKRDGTPSRIAGAPLVCNGDGSADLVRLEPHERVASGVWRVPPSHSWALRFSRL